MTRDEPWQDPLLPVGPSKEERLDAAEVMEFLDVPERSLDALMIEIDTGRCPQPCQRWRFISRTLSGKAIWDKSRAAWRWRRGDVEAAAARLQAAKVKEPELFPF